jgi:hypothetical protein
MTNYDFSLILSSPSELTEEFADKLFAAGCDDATPSSTVGILSVDFSREAADLETAIRSAVANVSSAGGVVDRVEIDADAAVLKQ